MTGGERSAQGEVWASCCQGWVPLSSFILKYFQCEKTRRTVSEILVSSPSSARKMRRTAEEILRSSLFITLCGFSFTKQIRKYLMSSYAHPVPLLRLKEVLITSLLGSWLLSFIHSVVSDSLRPHGPQHARLP